MGLIGTLTIAVLVIAGCRGASKSDCLASSTVPPSCASVTPDTNQPHPTIQSIEDELKAEGYARTTQPGTRPASWVKEDTVVTVGQDLSGSVEVTFPQGKVRCNHLGAEPSGPSPLRLANDLKSKGFGLAKTTFGCAAF